MRSIPIHLVTGFLGSGKTTLINALLTEPALAGTAVLVNELGAIAIDHDLVESVEPGQVVTTTGCLCCTASSDVVVALADLAARRASGRAPSFERVVVETTGLADPAPVVASLLAPVRSGAGEPAFHLASVVTLYDTMHGAATLDQHFEAVKQLALADTVVLSKTDLALDPASRADIVGDREAILALNPGALILDGRGDRGRLVGLLRSDRAYDLGDRGAEALGWLQAEAVMARSHGSPARADGGEGSAGRRHLSAVAAHAIELDQPIDPRGFYFFLEALRLSAGAKMLRCKGLFCLADDPERPLVVHGVQHAIMPVARLERWPSGDRRTRFVMIGSDLKPEIIKRMLTGLRPRPLAPAADRTGAS
jgi:G3E family GTPase